MPDSPPESIRRARLVIDVTLEVTDQPRDSYGQRLVLDGVVDPHGEPYRDIHRLIARAIHQTARDLLPAKSSQISRSDPS